MRECTRQRITVGRAKGGTGVREGDPQPQLGEQVRQCPQANTERPPVFGGISVTGCAGIIQPASPRHSTSLHLLRRPTPQLCGSLRPNDPMDRAARCAQRTHRAPRHLRFIAGGRTGVGGCCGDGCDGLDGWEFVVVGTGVQPRRHPGDLLLGPQRQSHSAPRYAGGARLDTPSPHRSSRQPLASSLVLRFGMEVASAFVLTSRHQY